MKRLRWIIAAGVLVVLLALSFVMVQPGEPFAFLGDHKPLNEDLEERRIYTFKTDPDEFIAQAAEELTTSGLSKLHSRMYGRSEWGYGTHLQRPAVDIIPHCRAEEDTHTGGLPWSGQTRYKGWVTVRLFKIKPPTLFDRLRRLVGL
jgi:hypothetical protein